MLFYYLAGALLADPPADAARPEPEAPGEIVVTGERTERSLKDTASSVVVMTARELEARPAREVEDLLAFVPNVQLGTGSQGPSIRGQDTTGALQALPAFLGGNRPRTTLIVDGRAVTYNEFVFGNAPLWDVERVEVFRSPQTTTQGQNSIAGAIFVHTADPTFEPEYRLRLIGGDFHTRQVSTVASAPISAGVAARVAGDLRYNRTTTEIRDIVEDGDPNHQVYGLLRSKLLFQPGWAPDSRLAVTFAHAQSQSPQLVQTRVPYRERRDPVGGYGVFRIRADSLTAAFDHRRNDVAAKLVLSAGDSLSERLAPRGFGQARNAARDWSAEAVVSWAPEGPLRLTAGIADRHVALNQRIDLSLLVGVPRFRDRQRGTGLFGEASYAFGSATVTAGLRYQRDRQRRTGGFTTAFGPIDLHYDRSFDAWLPKLSFAYDLSPALTAGLLVQKAYNPGGTTLRFDTGEPDNFEAERLWDYEVFARAALSSGISLAINAFYYDMRNAQRAKEIRIPAPNGLTVGFADLYNVERARTYGAEAEARWRTGERLSAALGLGLLRTKVTDAGSGNPDIEGREFDRAPHLTASAAVDWRPAARVRLSAQVRHHGGYWSDPLNAPVSRVGSGTIADARGEYDAGRASLFAYARNLFDTFSIVARDPLGATLENPREVGVGVEARF